MLFKYDIIEIRLHSHKLYNTTELINQDIKTYATLASTCRFI